MTVRVRLCVCAFVCLCDAFGWRVGRSGEWRSLVQERVVRVSQELDRVG